jgi:cysteine synthase A
MEVENLEKNKNLKAKVLVKLELFNPAGSVKDRVALHMIEDAEAKGLLKEGATIIEPTSGNTGIGLAAIAASKGYHAIFTMPETMSVERQKLLLGYGAEIVLTEGAKGMTGAIAKAKELEQEIENAIVLGQFDNPANPQAHYDHTGPEIWADTDGELDIFVSAVGTGGTLSGIGEVLKAQNPGIEIWAVEPQNAAILAGGTVGTHLQMGIGDGLIPDNLNTQIYSHICVVTDEEALECARNLARKEGLLAGISGGTNVFAALKLAKRLGPGKTVVTVLPDTAERYFSTPLFSE